VAQKGDEPEGDLVVQESGMRTVRFSTEGQILKAIDKAKEKFSSHQRRAEAHEEEAQRLFKYAGTFELNSLEASDARRSGRYEKEQAAIARRTSERIEKKLLHLGERLSVFRTPTLSLGNAKLEDHSIPV
jgi:hypothetical protein